MVQQRRRDNKALMADVVAAVSAFEQARAQGAKGQHTLDRWLNAEHQVHLNPADDAFEGAQDASASSAAMVQRANRPDVVRRPASRTVPKHHVEWGLDADGMTLIPSQASVMLLEAVGDLETARQALQQAEQVHQHVALQFAAHAGVSTVSDGAALTAMLRSVEALATDVTTWSRDGAPVDAWVQWQDTIVCMQDAAVQAWCMKEGVDPQGAAAPGFDMIASSDLRAAFQGSMRLDTPSARQLWAVMERLVFDAKVWDTLDSDDLAMLQTGLASGGLRMTDETSAWLRCLVSSEAQVVVCGQRVAEAAERLEQVSGLTHQVTSSQQAAMQDADVLSSGDHGPQGVAP